MSDHASCPLCGCVAIEDAIPATLATIAEDGRRRMPRVETLAFEMTDDERAIVAEWIMETRKRPPLDRPSFATISAMLDALAFDLADRTMDPASPAVAGWVIPMPHPRVVTSSGVDGLGMVEP